jgi:hypothetical protein
MEEDNIKVSNKVIFFCLKAVMVPDKVTVLCENVINAKSLQSPYLEESNKIPINKYSR